MSEDQRPNLESGAGDSVAQSNNKATNKIDLLRRKGRSIALAAGLGLVAPAAGFGIQGCLTDSESESGGGGHAEKIGKVQQALSTTWGQTVGNNYAPKVYWKDANNGVAVFVSDKAGGLGQTDIYISTTSNGPAGPWTAEALIDDSLSVLKVNTSSFEEGAVVCAGAACGTGKLIFSSARDGSDDLYWGDFDTTTLKVTNVAKLPVGVGKVNGNFTGEWFPTVDFASNKLYFNVDESIAVTDIGTWTKTTLTGTVGASINEGPSVFGTSLMASADSGCANVSGSLDACVYTLSGTTLSAPTNANTAALWTGTVNDAQEQFHPYQDSQGNVWVSSGTVGNRKIVYYPPVGSGADAGPDADTSDADAGTPDADTSDADAGSDASDASDAGDTDASDASDAGPDIDAGTDASPDGGEGGADAGPDMDAGDASVDMDAGDVDSGPTDAGMDADTMMDAGPDADAMMDADVPMMDASTDAGEGGSDAGKPKDCAMKLESGPGVITCDESGSLIEMKTTANDQEVTFVGPKPGCSVSFTHDSMSQGNNVTFDGSLHFPAGMPHHVVNVNHCFTKGTISGLDAFYEGTEPVVSYNPDFNRDSVHVVTIHLLEGQIGYEHAGKPIQSVSFPDKKCADGKACPPGKQPAKTTQDLDLNLYASFDPNKQPVVAPPESSDDGGGCTISSTQKETHLSALAIVAIAALAAAERRRQKAQK